MPQILDEKDYDAWLNPKLQDKDEILEMIKPIDSKLMQSHPVDTIVNNPRNNSSDCIKPVK